MLIFDHFRDAVSSRWFLAARSELIRCLPQSASLRSVYSDQLRDRGIVQEALMSRIPDILRQACNGVKPSDSMYFAVDEFHLEGEDRFKLLSTSANLY